MLPSYWYSPLVAYLWQIAVHSCVAAIILGAWSNQLRLGPGRGRRWILCFVLVLPMLTALVPGRNDFDFREQSAWIDTARLLAVPLAGGVHVFHAALVIGAMSVLATIAQELVPVLRRVRADFDAAPEAIASSVRSLPGWEHCRVGVVSNQAIVLAASGLPQRPQLILSAGALQKLTIEELEAVIAHEHAHLRPNRWLMTHLIFCARALQSYNPVALWSFREYLNEVEIDCDAEAAASRDPKVLVRALLKVYASTSRRDFWARSTIRQRSEVLLGKIEGTGGDLPAGSMAIAAAVLLVFLPWIV